MASAATGDDARARMLARLRPARVHSDAEVGRMLRQAADLFDDEHAERLRRRADELDAQLNHPQNGDHDHAQ